MNKIKIFLSISLVLFSGFNISGCATYRTVEKTKIGNPLLYSGTRLDLYAINKNYREIEKFGVRPPKYPLLDLPASFAVDTLIFPVASGVAASEFIFNR